MAGALCYLLGPISGTIFMVLESRSSFVRFHATQSTITFVGLIVAQVVAGLLPLIGVLVSAPLSLAGFGLWLLLMWQAFQGERFKLPYVGDLSEERSRL